MTSKKIRETDKRKKKRKVNEHTKPKKRKIDTQNCEKKCVLVSNQIKSEDIKSVDSQNPESWRRIQHNGCTSLLYQKLS